jgi:hypothetical protein
MPTIFPTKAARKRRIASQDGYRGFSFEGHEDVSSVFNQHLLAQSLI